MDGKNNVLICTTPEQEANYIKYFSIQIPWNYTRLEQIECRFVRSNSHDTSKG